jgi:hypothetical protein
MRAGAWRRMETNLAIKPVDNETFYREVDEELRRDQMVGFWRRYGFYLVAGAVLILALIGGVIWWQNQKQEKAGARGEALVAAFEDVQGGNAKAAGPRLDQLAKEGSAGYRAAALLTKADLAIQTGDQAGAVAAFKAVAEDDKLAEPFRNLALIRQTAIEFDRLPPAAVIQRLQPLAQAGRPWFGSAGELVAIAYLKQRKPQQAAPIFAALAKDKSLPRSLRSRALQMASAFGIDATEQAGGAAPGTPATKEETQ